MAQLASLSKGTVIDQAYIQSLITNINLRLHTTDGGTVSGATIFANSVTVNGSNILDFGSTNRQMIGLYSTLHGIGVQTQTTYFRAGASTPAANDGFAFYAGGAHAGTLQTPGGSGVGLAYLYYTGSIARLTVGGTTGTGAVEAAAIYCSSALGVTTNASAAQAVNTASIRAGGTYSTLNTNDPGTGGGLFMLGNNSKVRIQGGATPAVDLFRVEKNDTTDILKIDSSFNTTIRNQTKFTDGTNLFTVITGSSAFTNNPSIRTNGANVYIGASGTGTLNFNTDAGTGGIIFSNGAAGTVASVNSSGAWTYNVTAAGTTAETIATWSVSDDATGKLVIGNNTSADATFNPTLYGVSASTGIPLTIRADSTTDSGTNAAMAFNVRTTGGLAIVNRPLYQWWNNGTSMLALAPLSSGANAALIWPATGLGVPAFTTRTAGAKIVLYNSLSGTAMDYGFGVAAPSTGQLYAMIPQANTSYEFCLYAGVTKTLSMRGDGLLDVTGVVRSTGSATASAGAGVELGYTGGAGYVTSYDRTGAAYTALNLAGLTAALAPNGTATFTAAVGLNTSAVPIAFTNALGAYKNLTTPSIYSTGTGASYPFDTAGNLVLEPRNSGSSRDVVVIGSGGVVAHKLLNDGTYTPTTQIFMNRTGNANARINWYDNATYKAWVDYVGTPATTMNGVTPSTGTLVTLMALRSFVENTAGNGWIWESGTTTSTTPSTMFEISSVDGSFKAFGNGTILGTAGLSLTDATAGIVQATNTYLDLRANSGANNNGIRLAASTSDAAHWTNLGMPSTTTFFIGVQSATTGMTLNTSGDLSLSRHVLVPADGQVVGRNASADYLSWNGSGGTSYWLGNGPLIVRFDSDSSDTTSSFKVQKDAGTDLLTVAENGDLTIVGSLNATGKYIDFSQDTATTTGLTYGFRAGAVRMDATITLVSAGTIALTASTTNYVEYDFQAGAVVKNTTGFSSSRYPIASVVTNGSAITGVTDARTWIQQPDNRISIAGGCAGKPGNSQKILIFKADKKFILPASCTGSQGTGITAAAASTTFTIKKNGSAITGGTIVWATSGTTPTFANTSAVTFAVGDVLTVEGPATADSALADIGITLQGVLA